MSIDSAPAYEKAPTFDDVVKYAVDNDMFGKISLTKFYDYYGNFRGKGEQIIDWQSKLRQWVGRQSSPPVISAKEYEAQARIQKRTTPKKDIIDELWAKVAMI